MILLLIGLWLFVGLYIWCGSIVIPWLIHREMTVEGCDFYGYGTYAQFITLYNQTEWDGNHGWIGSMFGKNYDQDKFHAGIVMFRGKGFVFKSPFAFRKAKKFVSRKYNKTKINWENAMDA